MLAKSWEVSEDALTWTFYLNEGVQFHKGYGELTADDVVWSFDEFANSSIHPRNLAGNPESPQAVIFLASITDVMMGS